MSENTKVEAEFRFPNKVIKADSLEPSILEGVRNQQSGLFKNTFIVDREKNILHMYTREGQYHCSDIEFTYALSEYEWYMTEEGYIVSDEVDPDEKGVELGRLVLTYLHFTS